MTILASSARIAAGNGAAVLELAVAQVAKSMELCGVLRADLDARHQARGRLPPAVSAMPTAAAGGRRGQASVWAGTALAANCST
jgi:hypothetical protein